MFKLIALTILGMAAVASAKPGVVAYTATVPVAAPVAYSAALTAAPVVATATSSQYVARNYNGLVSPYVAAPYVAAPYPYASAYPYAGAYPYASAAYVL